MDQINQIQQLYNKIPKQVIAKFSTKLSEYEIDNAQIDLPTSMDQNQCNKLLKQFLQVNIDQSVLQTLQFQFLVGGKLLRGQLKSHIIRYEISCEQTLTIQYFLAFQPLQNQEIIESDDWISAIEIIYHPLGNFFATAQFDGIVNVYSRQNKQVIKYQADEDTIKAIKILPAQIQNSYYVISGGLNEQIRISHLSTNQANKSTLDLISTTQQETPILGIDINPLQDGHFCCANNEGNVSIYKIPQQFLSQNDQFNQSKKKKKKVHLNQKSIQFVASQKFHQGAINSINWITQDRIVTGSADHSIKLIDVQKMNDVGSILTKDSITTSIDYSNDRLLTSHEDGYIRLWDIRAPQMPTNTYKSHSKLASCVKFNKRSYIFASASYDTTVKIWDTRSTFPIQNIGTHHEKVFCVNWKQQKQLIAAGADSKVSIHNI